MAIFADRRYRRIKSPISGMSDFGDKIRQVCPFQRFLRSSLRIATKVNQSDWAILSHDFSKMADTNAENGLDVSSLGMKLKCQIDAIDVKHRPVCPHQSKAKFARDFRWRSNSLRSAYKIAGCVAGLRQES